jgi:hypothetical protein
MLSNKPRLLFTVLILTFYFNISTKDPNFHASSVEEAEEASQSNLSTAGNCWLLSPQPIS